jgi:uracil-DNA glycosylase
LSNPIRITKIKSGFYGYYFLFLEKLYGMDVKIEASWNEVLKNEFTKPYFQQIVTFLKTEKAAGKIIYPPGPLIFNAFNQTPFTKLKVAILGQDPYHGPGQAHGLSFSVPNGIKPPPSLVNIFKEIQSDIGVAMPLQYGNLTRWAEQGVLLLNAALTVRANEPFSHAKFGWADFTDAVIKKISEEKKGIVFLLWGKFAQDKQVLIDETKHLVLKAAHPSPFSADKGFFGCKHFSKTNEFLTRQGLSPIDWKLLTP